MRVLFLLFLTVLGAVGSFSNAFYGILTYIFYSIASPVQLVWWEIGYSSINLSFGVAAITIVTSLTQNRRIIILDKVTIFAFLFVLASYASLVVRSDVAAATWSHLWLLVRIVIMMVVAAALIDNIQKLKIVMLSVAVFTGLLGAYYGYTGLLAGSTWITGPGGVGGGRFGDNNGYAVWLTTSLPFIWIIGEGFKNKFWRYFAKFIFLGNVLAVMLTFSRSGALTMMACLLLLIIPAKRKVSYCAILFSILFVMYFMIFPRMESNITELGMPNTSVASYGTAPEKTIDSYKGRMQTVRTYEKEATAISRWHFWNTALIMANDNPVLGVGFTRYEDSYDMYDETRGRYDFRRAVHNALLDILAGTGYLGFSMFILMGLSAFASVGKFVAWLKRERHVFQDEFTRYATMVVIALVTFIGGSMFVTTIFYDIFWITIAMCSAMGAIAATNAVEYKKNMKWERYIWEKL